MFSSEFVTRTNKYYFYIIETIFLYIERYIFLYYITTGSVNISSKGNVNRTYIIPPIFLENIYRGRAVPQMMIG